MANIAAGCAFCVVLTLPSCFTTARLPPFCRGIVSPEGKLWLSDYPYAQDGLDLWSAYLEYFTAYLKLYYKSDADVLDDREVQAWWTEVKVSSAGCEGCTVRCCRTAVSSCPEQVVKGG